MTEIVLGLIPDYGLYVVFGVMVLACMAVPLPASMLVLASGGFVASGDLILWQVLAVTFCAYVIGDHLAYRIAHVAGAGLMNRLRRKRKTADLVRRSEELLHSKGRTAVLMSHTIVSPTCAYVTYLCGAGGMPYGAFGVYAALGAAVWTGFYVGVGYVFANQLSQVSEILSNFFGLTMAGLIVGFSLLLLAKKWKARKKVPTATRASAEPLAPVPFDTDAQPDQLP